MNNLPEAVGKWIITAVVVLIVLVDFTSWFLSFSVEACMGAVILMVLWNKKKGVGE